MSGVASEKGIMTMDRAVFVYTTFLSLVEVEAAARHGKRRELSTARPFC
jgi:hypothetical protein